jgi:hypothetical protein
MNDKKHPAADFRVMQFLLPWLAAICLFKYIDFSAITRPVDGWTKVGGMFPYLSDLQLCIKT